MTIILPDDKLVAVRPVKMHVGFNYSPWNCYGNYLGERGDWGRNWTVRLTENLKALHQIGIDVVRIFLLGNLSNYNDLVENGQLSPHVRQQLHAMFGAFKEAHCRVIPSIIDFKAFGRQVRDPRYGVQKNGTINTNGCTDRYDIVENPTVRRAFLNTIVQELLNIGNTPAPNDPDPSHPENPANVGLYKRHIYAWEVMNEPYWNCCEAAQAITALESIAQAARRPRKVVDDNIPSFLQKIVNFTGSYHIARATMSEFLSETLQLIERANFRSTVGHRYYSDLAAFPDGTGTLRQFHFYPSMLDPDTKNHRWYWEDSDLGPYSVTKAVVGEFGVTGCTVRIEDGKPKPTWEHGGPWPAFETPNGNTDDNYTRPQQTDKERVLKRLKKLEQLGYPLAMIWPAPQLEGEIAVAPGPDPINWKIRYEVREAVKDFVAGK